MSVRLVCPKCSWRYAGVVNPSCECCAGTGLLAVVVPEDVDPWVAARAATLDGVQREAKLAAGLLSADVSIAAGLPVGEGDTADFLARSKIGREAGKLLRAMKVRQPPPPRKKAQRRSKAEIAAEREAKERAKSDMHRRTMEWRAEQKRQKQEAAAIEATLDAYRARHPEEFEEVYEAERTMATISELPAVNVRGWCGGAR